MRVHFKALLKLMQLQRSHSCTKNALRMLGHRNYRLHGRLGGVSGTVPGGRYSGCSQRPAPRSAPARTADPAGGIVARERDLIQLPYMPAT